jgi:iron-sulfur cluster assembly protein
MYLARCDAGRVAHSLKEYAQMLTLTPEAQIAISRFMSSANPSVTGLRIAVTDGGCSGLQYGMSLELEARSSDVVVEFDALNVLVDPDSAPLLAGVTVDYTEGMEGSGFKFENPNAARSCSCGKSFSA